MSSQFYDHFKRMGVTVDTCSTWEACSTFNMCNDDNMNVACALITNNQLSERNEEEEIEKDIRSRIGGKV